MEESDRVEIGVNKKAETNNRKMAIFYALIGVLALAGAGVLLYFSNSSTSVKEANSASVKEANSAESKEIKNNEPLPKDQYFFDVAELEDATLTIVRLNDEGNFSERFVLELPEALKDKKFTSQISQSTETICMAAAVQSDFQVYTLDLKSKTFNNVLTVPYDKSQVGIPYFLFSPDCGSFAYYFVKDNPLYIHKEISKVTLKDFKSGVDYQFDWGTGKDPSIFLKNDGRVIKVTKDPRNGREVWLLTKENKYQEEKLFDLQNSCLFDENNFFVSDDTSRIFYSRIEVLKFQIMLFDASKKAQKFIGDYKKGFWVPSDGGKIAIVDDKGTKVEIIDVESGTIEKEFNLVGHHRLNYWSTNYKFLFFDDGGLKRLSISDGSFEPIKDSDGKILNVSYEPINR